MYKGGVGKIPKSKRGSGMILFLPCVHNGLMASKCVHNGLACYLLEAIF